MPQSPAEALDNEFLARVFPRERADHFFEALYGDAEEGAFDIALACTGFDGGAQILKMEFRLTERPGHCMACNLTYGLPEVFVRHPIINLVGIIDQIAAKLGGAWRVAEWNLGRTTVLSKEVNAIPLSIRLEKTS